MSQDTENLITTTLTTRADAAPRALPDDAVRAAVRTGQVRRARRRGAVAVGGGVVALALVATLTRPQWGPTVTDAGAPPVTAAPATSAQSDTKKGPSATTRPPSATKKPSGTNGVAYREAQKLSVGAPVSSLPRAEVLADGQVRIVVSAASAAVTLPAEVRGVWGPPVLTPSGALVIGRTAGADGGLSARGALYLVTATGATKLADDVAPAVKVAATGKTALVLAYGKLTREPSPGLIPTEIDLATGKVSKTWPRQLPLGGTLVGWTHAGAWVRDAAGTTWLVASNSEPVKIPAQVLRVDIITAGGKPTVRMAGVFAVEGGPLLPKVHTTATCILTWHDDQATPSFKMSITGHGPWTGNSQMCVSGGDQVKLVAEQDLADDGVLLIWETRKPNAAPERYATVSVRNTADDNKFSFEEVALPAPLADQAVVPVGTEADFSGLWQVPSADGTKVVVVRWNPTSQRLEQAPLASGVDSLG